VGSRHKVFWQLVLKLIRQHGQIQVIIVNVSSQGIQGSHSSSSVMRLLLQCGCTAAAQICLLCSSTGECHWRQVLLLLLVVVCVGRCSSICWCVQQHRGAVGAGSCTCSQYSGVVIASILCCSCC
jgi:hypothetical protein